MLIKNAVTNMVDFFHLDALSAGVPFHGQATCRSASPSLSARNSRESAHDLSLIFLLGYSGWWITSQTIQSNKWLRHV